MAQSDLTGLAAYVVAGLVAIGCSCAPGCSRAFRAWCATLGLFVAGWPVWVLLSDAWYLPARWRLVPLLIPVLLLTATVAAVARERHVRELLGTLPEIEDTGPDPDLYPHQPPPGQVAPPHDPWKALYASLARQRAKWESAGDRTPVADRGPGDAPTAGRGGDHAPAGGHDGSGDVAKRRTHRADGYRGRHRPAGSRPPPPPAPAPAPAPAPEKSGALHRIASALRVA